MNKFMMASISVFVLAGCSKTTEPNNEMSFRMVQVAGGAYQMGSTTGYVDEAPVHTVTVSSFQIDNTEIAYDKWTEVLNWGLTHGYSDLPTGRMGKNGTTIHPVTEVSWNDALKWCNARSEKDGFSPVYYTRSVLDTVYRTGQINPASDAVAWAANGYRLPTEAEWEFAARGGLRSQGYTYSGSNDLGSVAWFITNSDLNTHPVSAKQGNELGLYDMSGNVAEWCWDWYGHYSDSAQTEPKGPSSGNTHVLRGGMYNFDEYNCRVAFRDRYPTYRDCHYGFRCVRKAE